LQGLCCLDVRGEGATEAVLAFLRDSRESLETVAEAEGMLRSVLARRGEADALLSGQSRHWEVGRMALVDRNILRLAVCELLAGQTPKKVVISEALRLANEFGSAESSRFVNGVLDAAAHRILRSDSRDAGDKEKEELRRKGNGNNCNDKSDGRDAGDKEKEELRRKDDGNDCNDSNSTG